ncbi:ditrans,polycis-undecaprenyl-diphosphate synthase ((2E,6E)-farnesyl-diphosphate specific) [Peptococcaceae bacterium CEB3]|nr:ditrans,polycis-undecaprenyl-diphosphate synthase ((2E,6E)-farnesyl-diphosphate specific) [Peptococcaceae bacterium CEB3]
MWSGPWKRNKEVSSAQIDRGRIPRHIAIIMDGNGRWAIRRGLPRSLGHKAGVEALRGVVKACSRLGVEYLTVYAFSTENWRRPKEEVGILMSLLTEYLRRELQELDENDVVIRALGQIEHLPAEARTELARAFERTKKNHGLVLNLALNYGGRAELVGAVRGICRDVQGGRLKSAEIDENVVDRYLYTAGIPDPDLLIRTSGEMRLSNFLLWQCAYTEMVIVQDYWPDFNEEALLQAIKAYQQRGRRFGGLANE